MNSSERDDLRERSICDYSRLSKFKVGEIVLAGSGISAELRLSFVDYETTPDAIVRWLNSAHHSRVPWETIKKITS